MTKTEAKSSTPPPRKPKPGLVVDINKKVDIQGLKGGAQYNGMEGRITAGPNEKGRYLVQLIYQGNMKELALLPENLIPKPPCGWEVVAAGLSSHISEEDIARVFSKFGPVQHAKVTRDQNGLSKGVALIVMAGRDGAEKALSQVEVDICGIGVKLQWSTMVKQEMGLLKNRDEEFAAASGAAPPAPGGGGAPAAGARKFQEEHKGEAAPSGPFQTGQRVRVSGLKSAPQYNGLAGTVQGIRADGRCEVLLQAPGEEAKTLALKPDNLSATEADGGAGGAGGAGGGGGGGRRRFSEGPAAASSSSAPGSGQASCSCGEALPPGSKFCSSCGAKVEAGASAGDGASASGAGAAAEPPRRRRKSAWGENEGGEVYVGSGNKTAASSSSSGAPSAPAAAAPPAPTPAPGAAPADGAGAGGGAPEPLPASEEELGKLSAGALRRLLESHKVDLTSCIEKADFLAKAKELLASSR